MSKIEVKVNTKVTNRYFHECKLARQFAKDHGAKVIRVNDKAKGKYLVQYVKLT